MHLAEQRYVWWILSERLWIPPIGDFYFCLENKTVEIYYQIFFKVTVNSSLRLYCTSAAGFSFTKQVKTLQSQGQYNYREPFTRNFSYISREKNNYNKGLRKIIIVNGPHMVFFLCVFYKIYVFFFSLQILSNNKQISIRRTTQNKICLNFMALTLR